MKNIILFCAALFMLNACKGDSSPVEDKIKIEPVTARNYYPGKVGSIFKYKVERVDTSAVTADSLSVNFNSIDSLVKYNGIEYFAQNGSLLLNGANAPTKILFRRTDAAVYFTIDTTGFNLLLLDSLLQDITINSDPEANIFSFPLFDGKSWTAYKLNIGIGAFELSLVDVRADYLGAEQLKIPAVENPVEAVKIRYAATIKIPDPNNLTNFTESKFDLFGWFAADIGLVKFEGNISAVNLLIGSDVLPADSTSIIRETLSEFSL